ncbi:MAG: hypothetical protein A3B68_07450 [Candidatus Melainabacteria bacterium RIFCSPHIGHO2_02_FULL_34_12]|nr:MAG: hypothetical protein A3B68_07450 [Candidatus Melainabacteria bacterium RIFCSPHIGHO2_02_FULL_34_12]
MSVHNKHFLIQKRERKVSFSLPANVFGYLGLCKEIKKNKDLAENRIDGAQAKLPLISTIIRRFTPQGVVYAHWSFLQY